MSRVPTTATTQRPHDDGYFGPATVVAGGREFTVTVRLRGYFQPIDGRYHWYGRITRHPELAAALGDERAATLIRTPHGEARGELSEPDLWERYRVMGTGRPPYPVDTAVPE
ncbi:MULTISPECIES: DUF4873 domain-containing protein [Streptomycetaceae]|uniref:DUF4873 domain-containing protein n=1 Tax=Streptantibioticus cattleyicolor (strain ATCC 35852 / DSM 46488 / JCM 4925 / NBRC 14057 / NRRL 8057) TaxID=1003195 RepID=F8K1T6_STREN|nr:DUF4873 domain-containing protein [Streptantibioticus cattleyicolor]AEW92405.1 hypothetical protein SCATT_00340 [Streptantibioticus cattleyicolor NRRL 8057 = DSM 46488]MYS57216.1 DUF4873 domain-containing protein [Streptomyces sp. SID5468]CCB72770.1 conserved protein of unknown function [Streptantibioticus cattleyicolor NRRL 8057 = DSM 46488]